MKKISLVLFAISFFIFGCGKYLKNQMIEPKYVVLEESNFVNQDKFFGYIKSGNSAILNFQTEGKIIYLPYTKGDFVKKNTLLAKIDGILYQIRLKEEKERLKNAQIQLNRNQSYYKRMDILHAQGAISDNDWEDAYFNLKTSIEQIDIQKEKVNYLNKQINFTSILAPYDGYITAKMVGLGENITPMQPIYSFVGAGKFFVETNVNFSVAQKLKQNDKVKLNIQNKEIIGNITHIAFSSINSAGYTVKISFDNSKLNIKEGQSVEIYFKNEKNGYYLPLETVFEEENQNFIFKLEKEQNDFAKIKKILIEIKKLQGEFALVELLDNSTLKIGDSLLLQGKNKFFDGQKVKL